MRLSFLIHADRRRPAASDVLRFISAALPLPADQWEAWLIGDGWNEQTLAAARTELPNVRGLLAADKALAQCAGQYILDLRMGVSPDRSAITWLLSHLDSDSGIGAVTGRIMQDDGNSLDCSLPTALTEGATCFRRSVLDCAGGLSRWPGKAGEYDLTLRIADAGFRVERRDDILFRADAAQQLDQLEVARIPDQLCDLLTVASRLLPGRVAEAYWHDWKMRYAALADHSGAAKLAIWRARLSRWMQVLTDPEPVSRQALEAVFQYRRHAELIGEWARRQSVWRVVLADFSDNIWATYNACRSNGLQMRCVCDSNPAFHDLVYRDLPIVPTRAAFEGGGIDGAIVTHSDPARIEPQVRILHNYFHGPILRLAQTPRLATKAQAAA